MPNSPKYRIVHEQSESVSVFALMKDIFARSSALKRRRREQEITKEYLEALQQDIDSRMEEGLTFKTVKRASW